MFTLNKKEIWLMKDTIKPNDLNRVAGAINTSLLTFSLYLGISDSPTSAMVAPKEYPTTSTFEYPVLFITKSMTAGKSYIPIS